jgi:F-type H+-transporting ATPase subunit a
MFKLYSPLEQFDLVFLNKLFSYIDIANIHIYLIVILLLFSLINFFFNRMSLNFNFFFHIFQSIYLFVLEMLVQQAGSKAVVYFPFLFTTFFSILFFNLLGMLPFAFTVSAHLSVTFFIAFGFNLSFVVIGFEKNGLSFLKLFKPSGTPPLLEPLIIVIEVVSYLIRSFSLSIRLFANMMAGHCLLFVISSFVFSLLSIYTFVLIIIVYIMIFVLELAIAFLQSYVFTILLCIYLNDSLHPSH